MARGTSADSGGRRIETDGPVESAASAHGRAHITSHLTRCLRAGGADDVLVVGRPADQALRDEADRCGARFVENPNADRGQLSSLVAGLDIVDRPGVSGYRHAGRHAARASGHGSGARSRRSSAHAPIVRVTHEGRHGHPVVFGRAVFDDLRHADYSIGAKAVLQTHAAAILNVEVDDAAVLRDVDTPEDYRAIFGQWSKQS